jgi:hypothetical protein
MKRLLWILIVFSIASSAHAFNTAVTISAVAPSNIVEGQGNLLFIIRRIGDLPGNQVLYKVTGTAKSGSDYQTPTGVAQFVAGLDSFTLRITTLNDNIGENSETVTVTIIPPIVAGAYQVGNPASATGTIDDDEPVVYLNPNTSALVEQSNSIVLNAGFVLKRSGSSALSIPVRISLRGTATNGTDYAQVTSPVTIPAGQFTAQIRIGVTDDFDIDPDETVTVDLINVLPPATLPYRIGSPSSVTLTIKDNDPPEITLAPLDGTAEERDLSTAAVRVQRSGDLQRDLSVNYFVNPANTPILGTQASANDFQPLPGSIVVPRNQTKSDIVVTPVNDNEIEGTEKVLIKLAPGVNTYNLGTNKDETISILDDDLPLVSVGITDGIANETPGDTGIFRFTRTGPTTSPLSVKFGFSGTISTFATLGQDFTLPIRILNNTVVIPAGQSTLDVELIPVDDTIPEGQEQAKINILQDPAYLISPSGGSGTIFISDND